MLPLGEIGSLVDSNTLTVSTELLKLISDGSVTLNVVPACRAF